MTIEFDFSGGAYTPPAGNALEFNFGSSVPTDVEVALTLPGPQVAVVFGGRVEVEVVAVLPGPTLSAKVAPTISLLFAQDPATNGDLVFSLGGADEEVVPGTELSVDITLPLPTVSAQIVPPVEVEVAAVLPPPVLQVEARYVYLAEALIVLPGPQVEGEALYKSNTQRPTVGKVQSFSQVARPESGGATHRMQDGAAHPAGWQGPWQSASRLSGSVEHVLPSVLRPAEVSRRGPHQDAHGVARTTQLAHQEAARSVRKLLASAFEDAAAARAATGFKHQDADRRKRASHFGQWQEASSFGVRNFSTFQPASPLLKGLGGRFQDGMSPPPGVWVPPVTPPPEGTPCYTPNPHLLFAAIFGSDTNLLFQCDAKGSVDPEQPPTTIPVKRVYIVLNNVNLRRVSDNAVVPTLSMSLSLDASSWTWGFDATLPGSAQALVEPTVDGPVELRATVNGTEFRVLAENLSRERVFGQVNIKVSGRGRNAVLDAPYAPQQLFSNTQERTSQQLMEDVLQINGVPLGFAIDYGLEAWNVPAGVFNHQGTYISALAALAQAGGGYLIPHPSAQSFKVRHFYPTKPWEPITPDFILPADVLVRESVAWKEKPNYNRVYVSGQDQGVLGRVTRAGTSGDILAPMVTDPLITSAVAARQRGLAVLGDTGRQLELGISLPVLNETGIIQPGMYVQYVDGSVTRTGIVRSTQVQVGEIEVKQTLGVEVHA